MEPLRFIVCAFLQQAAADFQIPVPLPQVVICHGLLDLVAHGHENVPRNRSAVENGFDELALHQFAMELVTITRSVR